MGGFRGLQSARYLMPASPGSSRQRKPPAGVPSFSLPPATGADSAAAAAALPLHPQQREVDTVGVRLGYCESDTVNRIQVPLWFAIGAIQVGRYVDPVFCWCVDG